EEIRALEVREYRLGGLFDLLLDLDVVDARLGVAVRGIAFVDVDQQVPLALLQRQQRAAHASTWTAAVLSMPFRPSLPSRPLRAASCQSSFAARDGFTLVSRFAIQSAPSWVNAWPASAFFPSDQKPPGRIPPAGYVSERFSSPTVQRMVISCA